MAVMRCRKTQRRECLFVLPDRGSLGRDEVLDGQFGVVQRCGPRSTPRALLDRREQAVLGTRLVVFLLQGDELQVDGIEILLEAI